MCMMSPATHALDLNLAVAYLLERLSRGLCRHGEVSIPRNATVVIQRIVLWDGFVHPKWSIK